MQKILTIFVLIVLSTSLFAQDEKLKNFRFGLKFVPSLYWVSPDNTKDFKSSGSKVKFSYGLITDFKLNKTLFLSTGVEINYTSFGINFEAPTYYLSAKDTFNLGSRAYNATYIDIPITLKMKTPEIGYITYFGQFGLDFSVRAKAKADDKGTLSNTVTIAELSGVNITADTNPLKLALNIGGGLEYNVAGSTSLLVHINYHNGFTNILKKESGLLYNSDNKRIEQNATLNYISLSLGVLF